MARVDQSRPEPIALSPASVLRPADGLLHEEIEGDLVVLDVAGHQVHQLNGVGAYAWQQMDGAASLGQIAGQIAAHFEVSEVLALRDLKVFCGELLAAAALVVVDGGES